MASNRSGTPKSLKFAQKREKKNQAKTPPPPQHPQILGAFSTCQALRFLPPLFFFPPCKQSQNQLKVKFLMLSSPEIAGFYPGGALGPLPNFGVGLGVFPPPPLPPARREVKLRQEIREGGGVRWIFGGGWSRAGVCPPHPHQDPQPTPCAHPRGVLGYSRSPPDPPKSAHHLHPACCPP